MGETIHTKFYDSSVKLYSDQKKLILLGNPPNFNFFRCQFEKSKKIVHILSKHKPRQL